LNFKTLDLKNNPCHRIYLHIPFCRHRCHYCDFFFVETGESGPGQLEKPFVDALINEWSLKKHLLGTPLQSIYFGGGTPSLLSKQSLKKIMSILLENTQNSIEVTLEANPVDLSKEKLETLREVGINRLSLGVQGLQLKRLQWLDRSHDQDTVFHVLKTAEKVGFHHLSIDYLYGVPGLDPRIIEKELQELCRYPSIKHISAYALTLSRANPHFKILPHDDECADQMAVVEECLRNEGFYRYEVSNYARGAQWEASHNRSYWNLENFLGLGPSASSFLFDDQRRMLRLKNKAQLDHYIEKGSRGEIPPFSTEELNEEQKKIERLYTGLRYREGLPRKEWLRLYPDKKAPPEKEAFLLRCIQADLISTRDPIRCTSKGWALLDEMIRMLI
jgi:oxygen-independent coproporphyrinogen-3 oxidase